MGPRFSVRSRAVHPEARRKRRRRRGADHQARFRVFVRARHRQTTLSHRVSQISASTIPGEVAASEQPLPTQPAPYARQLLTEEMLSNRTPEVHQWAVEQFRKSRSEGQFVPFSLGKDTVIFPGFDGGAEWGGPAIDPETATIYVNSNEMAWMAALAENTDSC